MRQPLPVNQRVLGSSPSSGATQKPIENQVGFFYVKIPHFILALILT